MKVKPPEILCPFGHGSGYAEIKYGGPVEQGDDYTTFHGSCPACGAMVKAKCYEYGTGKDCLIRWQPPPRLFHENDLVAFVLEGTSEYRIGRAVEDDYYGKVAIRDEEGALRVVPCRFVRPVERVVLFKDTRTGAVLVQRQVE